MADIVFSNKSGPIYTLKEDDPLYSAYNKLKAKEKASIIFTLLAEKGPPKEAKQLLTKLINDATARSSGNFVGEGVTTVFLNAQKADPLNPFLQSDETKKLIEQDRLQEQEKVEAEKSEAQKAADERLTAQCILLDGIDLISPKNFNQRVKSVELNPYTAGMEGDRATFASSINGSELKSKFLDFTTAQLASLTPVIRLYKVIQNNDATATTTDYLIPFSTHTAWRSGLTTYGTVDDLLAEGRERPIDVGITSFSWTFEGTNPVSSRRDISAKLVLFSNSLNNLVQQFNIYPSNPKPDKPSHCFEYIDLVLRSGKKFKADKSWNAQYYAIKIEIGWKTENTSLFPEKQQRESLEKNTTTMLLTLIDHNFNFGQDGTVSLTLDYRAYFEGLLFSDDFDILKNAVQTGELDTLTAELTELKEKIQPLDEDEIEPNPADKEQYDEALKAREQLILDISKTSYSNIITTLRDNKQIYCIKVDVAQYNTYKSNLSTSNPTELNILFQPDPDNSIAAAVVSNANAALATATIDQKNPDLTNLFPDEDPGFKYITYFYLNDLFNSVIEECYKKSLEQPNKPKFLFGSALYYFKIKGVFDPFKFVNILDIPVSLEWYSEWFANTIVSQNKTSYPILYFIRDMCSKLINNILSNTCDKTKTLRAKNKFNIIDFNVSLLPDSNSPDNDPIYEERKKQQGPNIPVETLINIYKTHEPLKGSDTSKNQQYIAVYCQDVSSPTKVDCGEDHKNGIYHFYFGRDRGLVKSINFTRSQTIGLRELNYARESSGKNYEQLMLPYDVEMKMVGNNLFFNGMMIFIDPSGFGRKFGTPDDPASFSYQLKLGGYHTIYRIQSSITTSGFETIIHARWTGSGTRSILTAKPKSGTPAGGGSTTESVSPAPDCSEYDSGFKYPDSSPFPVYYGSVVSPKK
jgi:hypothetical protein